ncbi:MAG TPA: hypothetical protein VH088_22150 [Terriglobales bacterium]|nr:hypothetical protein [Terriglobales bacterium]
MNSTTLHGSESLCKLLRYLAEHAVDHPGVALKEYQIATEVFGRPADFDPQVDSTIRVQAGRLRAKLSTYYNAEGAADPIVVEVPKGSYVLSFHHRAEIKPQLLPNLPEETKVSSSTSRYGSAVPVLVVLLVAAVGIIGFLLASHRTDAAGGEPVPAVFATFWKPFLPRSEDPWVIFSNGAFVGRPETGMRYFDHTRDSAGPILDHYTGVGEVLAVHELDRVFASLHREVRVKRGSLFSLDDAKNHDLIFVGSPAENLTLREIPGTHEFIFQRLASGPRKNDLAIVNVHPKAGEPESFLGSPSTSPLEEDYAVVALMRGLDPTESVIILAGTTTLGTQAAVEYVCQQSSLEQLLPQLKMSAAGEPEPFEAVLRVKIARGVPVESSLVAVRNQTSKPE